jgi:molybdate transport system substrate-binding protein
MVRTTLPLAICLFVSFTGCEKKEQSNASLAVHTRTITVFAAASTTDVMREAGRRFETATGTKVAFSFDSSSNLAKQLKAGAPADIFISADQNWMNDVAASGEIQATTREDLLGNELVFIAPVRHELTMDMSKDFDFRKSLPQIKRIAVGDPAHVPAGRYAKQALESLGWWTALEPLLIPAQDVRAALRLVELEEADAGIVYSTDAELSNKLKVIATFPPDTHEPIRYPVALCTSARDGASDFLKLLRSAEMVKVFEQAGFVVIPAATSGARGSGH